MNRSHTITVNPFFSVKEYHFPMLHGEIKIVCLYLCVCVCFMMLHVSFISLNYRTRKEENLGIDLVTFQRLELSSPDLLVI